jgi:tripartite-type tricarboxylate transporter receptor subunit TctC
MSVRRLAARLTLGVLLGVAGGPARAQTAPDPFYAGKTLSIIVDGGGAYETYARVLAQHLPKYIPGRPTVIVQEMPGAGGVRAANFLYMGRFSRRRCSARRRRLSTSPGSPGSAT